MTTDKVARARLPAAWAEAGLLHGDTGLPLWPTFERELVSFPLGSHDDMCDALSGAAAMALGPAGQQATAQAAAGAVRVTDERTARLNRWLREAIGPPSPPQPPPPPISAEEHRLRRESWARRGRPVRRGRRGCGRPGCPPVGCGAWPPAARLGR